MRIHKLILKNFIGIWNGLSKKSIELDFNTDKDGNPIDPNVITLFAGSNGSGKTTILSAMHVFSNTLDDRRDPIIPGTEGYKEVHLTDGDDEYIIKHYYGKSTKSYISKNGVEMNTNGRVGMFKKIVKSELEVDEDYFKIGRIGSNVTNFIDMTTSERKKYLSKFLPDIDEYLESFKVVSGKLRDLNRDIKYVSDQLDKLPDEVHVKAEIESKTKLYNEYKELELTYIQKLSVLDNKLNTLIDETKEYDLRGDNIFTEEYSQLKLEMEDAINSMNDYYQTYDNLELYTDEDIVLDLQESKVELTKDTTNKNNLLHELNKAKSSKVELQNKKVEYERKLNDFKKQGSLDELLEMENELVQKLESIKNELSKFSDITIDSTSTTYQEMARVGNKLHSMHKVLADIQFQTEDEILDLYVNSNFNDLEKMAKVNKSDIEKIKLEINSIETEISLKVQNSSKLDILEQRPDECSIDTCPFIKDALSLVGIDDEIAKLEDNLNTLNQNLFSKEQEAKKYEELLDIHNSVTKVYNQVDSLFKLLPVAKHFETLNSISELLLLTSNELESIFNIDSFLSYLQLLSHQESTSNQLDKLTDRIELVKQQDMLSETIKEGLNNVNSELKQIDVNITKYEDTLVELDGSINIHELKIRILEDLQSNRKVLNESTDKFNIIKDKYTQFNKDKEEYIELVNDINIETKLKEELVKNKIEPIEKELDGLNVTLSNIIDFNKRKSNLDEEYDIVKLVKDSLDPTKGIPLHFIDSYLDETTRIANELLDIAYDGKFRLKFDIDEKNFFIKVITENGDVKDDILLASQGEVALTTISISLAMIQQSVNRYNIISLDEIDATLDTHNRINFLRMIEKQIDILGIDQLLVISHNNEFDSYPVDLLLLKDHSLDIDNPTIMSNKNIIYEH